VTCEVSGLYWAFAMSLAWFEADGIIAQPA
jgi:hypothetical protein